MEKVQLIVVGGFLGAGKTTSILAMAKRLKESGKKVAIVTNDQSSNLVDSAYIKEQGFPVLEVTSGCFCCHFDDFIDRLNQISKECYPDVILAEPVGSCTDLISTIMKPIKRNYTSRFSLSPLSVVVDPVRLDHLTSAEGSGFKKEVSYLFLKQIEEADIIVLNKIDRLTDSQMEYYISYLKKTFPNSQIAYVSSIKEIGIEEWLAKTSDFPSFDKSSLNIVYNTYAAAEAALGWLNTSAILNAQTSFNANRFISEFAAVIQNNLKEHKMEIAHLKLCIASRTDFAKLSCVSIYDNPSVDREMAGEIKDGSLIVNIRADCTPDYLQNLVETEFKELADLHHVTISKLNTACFSPSYPNPIHRM